MNSRYTLDSRWILACDRDSLWDAIESLLGSDDPMSWWPAVQVTGYDGSDINVIASSRFGYQLTFCLYDLRTSRPAGFTLASRGDLRGTGEVAIFELDSQTSAMQITWQVATDRAWILRPLFVAGHHLVMRQGEKHLNAWLASHHIAES